MITIRSFSYRLGVPKPVKDGIDCRILNNPYNRNNLRPLDGKHADVQKFVTTDNAYKHLHTLALHWAERDGAVNFGCVGGRHRSVAMAELTAKALRTKGQEVTVEHWALDGLYPS